MIWYIVALTVAFVGLQVALALGYGNGLIWFVGIYFAATLGLVVQIALSARKS